LGILLGLTAALSWGVADFIARFATRRVGTYRTLFYMQVVGLAGASVGMAATHQFSRLAGGGGNHGWSYAVLCGALTSFGMLAFYRSLEVGALSIVGPIAASYPALTVVLAFFSGEVLTPARLGGVAMVLGGVVLSSMAAGQPAGPVSESEVARRSGGLAPGVLWAMCAAMGFGLVYWVLGFRMLPAWGAMGTVWLQRLLSLCVLAIVRPLLRQTFLQPGNAWLMVAGVGILDTAGFLASNSGFESEQVGIVTVLGSLFGAVTLLLAWIFLRERLVPRQWAGIGAIFTGIILINL
jgi:drug/metabolite transporter (DMT)-like permease